MTCLRSSWMGEYSAYFQLAPLVQLKLHEHESSWERGVKLYPLMVVASMCASSMSIAVCQSLTLGDIVCHCLSRSDTWWYCLSLSVSLWHFVILSVTVCQSLTLCDIVCHCLSLSDTLWYCLSLFPVPHCCLSLWVSHICNAVQTHAHRLHEGVRLTPKISCAADTYARVYVNHSSCAM